MKYSLFPTQAHDALPAPLPEMCVWLLVTVLRMTGFVFASFCNQASLLFASPVEGKRLLDRPIQPSPQPRSPSLSHMACPSGPVGLSWGAGKQNQSRNCLLEASLCGPILLPSIPAPAPNTRIPGYLPSRSGEQGEAIKQMTACPM